MCVGLFIQEDRTNELNDKEKDIFSISRCDRSSTTDKIKKRHNIQRFVVFSVRDWRVDGKREEQNDNNRQSEMEAISHKEFQLMALDRLSFCLFFFSPRAELQF